MHDVTDADIQQAVDISGLRGYTGKYSELGGGEVNDTFVLDCGEQKAVLRISRFPDNRMLRLESEALKLMNFERIPSLIFFDASKKIRNKLWIMESFVSGGPVVRLNVNQFRSLGQLLAQVHKTIQPETSQINFWKDYLWASETFGDESTLLNHPDDSFRELIRGCRDYFNSQTQMYKPIHKSLIHGDLSPNNMLVNGDEVSVIDWEFSTFKDPMADFSTIYYPDMEYNQGRWRVHIRPEEQAALFDGYQEGGGSLDEHRIATWMILDKIGAATYLYWKMFHSGHPIEDDRLEQYRLDYKNLIESLTRILS